MKKVLPLFLALGINYSNAEPLQDSFRYGTYGLVAGALAGGASMAFAEDPGSSLNPVARGASLGLYAGLVVALFKNMSSSKEPRYEVMPVGFNRQGNSSLGFVITKKF